MQIYLARNNQQAGPYTLEQINQMLASQQTLLTDLAWHQGMTEWKTLGELTNGQLFYQPSTTPTNNDPIVNTQTDTTQQPQYNHHYWGAKAEQQQVLASRGKRITAKLVDWALFFLPQMIVSAIFFPTDQVLEMVQSNQAMTPEQQMIILDSFSSSIPNWLNIALLIYTLFLLFMQQEVIRQYGQSIGKKLFKLKIVDLYTGEQIGSFRAFFMRSFILLMVSQFIFIFPLLGLLFLADLVLFFTKNNHSLHDRWAKTKVIDLSKK